MNLVRLSDPAIGCLTLLDHTCAEEEITAAPKEVRIVMILGLSWSILTATRMPAWFIDVIQMVERWSSDTSQDQPYMHVAEDPWMALCHMFDKVEPSDYYFRYKA